MLSRRNLVYCSHRFTPKPQCFSELRTLDLSLRSFSHSDPLFSITSALFLQNTRGGIPPAGPFRSRVLTIVLHEPIPSRFSLIPDSSSICFRINTCKSVSKQTTLTSFRINTYGKGGEGGTRLFRVSSVQPSSLQPPEPYAPRGASIPYGLSRLRILPVTTGVYVPSNLQKWP